VIRRQLSVPDVPGEGGPEAMWMIPPAAARSRTGGGMVLFDRLDPETAPVAGAKLVGIHDEVFGHIFGVSSGVLVTEVFSDPAQSTGLRGGDVILRADGQDLTSVAQFRRIVAAHRSDRVVDLQIVRQKRARVLTLRW
jgi:S1-C subfamily serine protease